MFRKGVSFGLGLALIVALGLAMAHAKALKASASPHFSVPCEPASPAIKTPVGESRAVLTLEASFATESANLATNRAYLAAAEAATAETAE